MPKRKSISSGFLTVENDTGLKAVFSTYGAGVYSLSLHGQPLILTPSDKKVYYSSDQYFGKTVGRVIGRIPFHLRIFDQDYDLLSTPEGICLHGGEGEGLAYRDFQGTVTTEKDLIGLELSYLSPDGEAGFPGNVLIRVTYLMPRHGNELIIRHEATTDKPTLFSISNHMYWNFGDKNVDDYVLTAKASRVGTFKEGTRLIVDSKAVPDYLDFHNGRKIAEIDEGITNTKGEIDGLDHAFLLDTVEPEKANVVLENEKFRLECLTDYDGVNLYVDKTDSPVRFLNGDVCGRRGIAIEPQRFPLSDRIIDSGKTYHHEIRYRFIEK